MSDSKKKENENNEDGLKELFKDFLMEWKNNKEKKGKEPENVPVPPEESKKEEKKEEEKKEEEKKPGFFDWLFG